MTLAIKSCVHLRCKACWYIELLGGSSARSSSVFTADLASVWPTFSAHGDFFFCLSDLFIWAWSGCSKSACYECCLFLSTYAGPEGLSSVGASTLLCFLGELWFFKIGRKLCSFPLVHFFGWQWKRSILAVWKDSWKTISGCHPSLWKMRQTFWCFQKGSCIYELPVALRIWKSPPSCMTALCTKTLPDCP